MEASAEADKPANVAQEVHFSRGDVAAGFAESDLVLEHTYRIPMVHQGYIEPHAVLADWDASGNLTLWASTQGMFNLRSEVAEILHLPEYKIKVIPMECGGGFGAKIRALCEPITALLARETGRPVRYVMSRREELEAGMPAPQVIIRLKTGVKQDGTLVALEADTTLESGAFAGAAVGSLREIVEWAEPMAVIGIDIPIGHVEGGVRQCDVEARRFVGPRRSSVFAAPPADVLDAATYADGNAALAGLGMPKLSRQAWALIP